LAATTVYLFAIYHNRMIDDNYQRAKRIIAVWRVLVGVWLPKRWDLSLAALSQYTTPPPPKENPWVEKPNPSEEGSQTASPSPSSPDLSAPEPASALRTTIPIEEPPVKTRPKRRPPSRRLVRHVLRARVEAVKALAIFFDHLQRAPSSMQVKASVHLARTYGHLVDVKSSETGDMETRGWRDVREVVRFLKHRGAKVPSLQIGPVEGEWAALSSEGESFTTVDDTETIWVPPSGDT